MTDQDFFFQYDKDPSGKTKFSNLSLLRRDINTCFDINPNDTSSKLGSSALWPGTMAILAGIDLLAKFYCGDDDNSKSRGRFINYVEKFIDGKHKEELYQLRNALLHSFGLYSVGKDNKIYRFILTQDPSYLIKHKADTDKYCISIKKLHELFEKSITDFSNVYPTLDSYTKFDEYFIKYGTTEIGKNGLLSCVRLASHNSTFTQCGGRGSAPHAGQSAPSGHFWRRRKKQLSSI